MNICAIICEFNPFHNGHAYLLEQARKLSGCDLVACIMSGSFTQRGDICVADKYVRARHAVLGGADCVLELPAAFAVAPAEIFSAGAIAVLGSVPNIKFLAFGCEDPSYDFKKAAKLLDEENETFKNALKNSLARGESYIKSYCDAFEKCGGDANVLSRPNNILALEYHKAVLRSKKNIAMLPVERKGADFNDENLYSDFSSASAIRKNPCDPAVKDNVPGFVFGDLKDFSEENRLFKELLLFGLATSDEATLKKIYGCGEGLENRLKSLACLNYDDLTAKASGRRYSASRIKRILLANLLKLYRDDCEAYLGEKLYLKPLAVKAGSAGAILSALSKSDFPMIMKQRDLKLLDGAARKCFESDVFAYKIWKFIAKKPEPGFDYMITV